MIARTKTMVRGIPGSIDGRRRRGAVPYGRARNRCANLSARAVAQISIVKERPVGVFSIISMIVVGFIVGALARWFYPGAINMGFWATAVVGVVGSLVGGVIGGLMWKSPD